MRLGGDMSWRTILPYTVIEPTSTNSKIALFSITLMTTGTKVSLLPSIFRLELINNSIPCTSMLPYFLCIVNDD